MPHRITRNLDLLGFGSCEVADLVTVFRDLCTVAVDDDGIFFDPASAIEPIRADELYVGVRVSFLGKIGSARLPMQVDVGFGDSLAAQPVEISFPSLLDMPLPLLRAYPVGLTEEFWNDASRQAVWTAFWRKSVRLHPMLSLQEAAAFAAEFLLPPMLAAAQGQPFTSSWKPGGPWGGAA